MKRGEIWWTSFDPSIGSEIKKTRPAIIISNNHSNKTQTRVQVIPITSKIEKLYPCETHIKIKGEKYKATADQISTISKARLREKIGKTTAEEIRALEQVIKIQLNLE